MILRGEVKNIDNGKILIEHMNRKLEILMNTNIKVGERVVVEIPDDIQDAGYSSEAEFNTIKHTQNMAIEKDPFKYISDLRKDKYITVMAVCTSFRPLTTTKGTDSLFSLNIKDHTGSIELKVFIKEEEYHRFIEECNNTNPHNNTNNTNNTNNSNNTNPYKPGDILILRSIKKSSNENFAVIAKPCIINRADDSIVQLLIKKHLETVFRSSMYDPILKSRKMKLIKDLSDRCFFDILGKVIFTDNTAKVPTICITDYTRNPHIVECPSNFPNNMVLAIKLFGHHSSMMEKISVGGYFIFKNIRVHLQNNVLEAYMHDYLEGDVIEINDGSFLEEIRKREENLQRVKKTENASNTKEKEIGIEFAEISEMNHPGIYLCKCLITDVIRLETGFFQIDIAESDKTYRMHTKSCLTRKIELSHGKVEPGALFKTLVLRTETDEFYLIDLFLNDEEYDEFLEFYRKEKHDLSR